MGRMGGLKTAELWGAWGVTPMAKTRGDDVLGLLRFALDVAYRCLGASQESFSKKLIFWKMHDPKKSEFRLGSAKFGISDLDFLRTVQITNFSGK